MFSYILVNDVFSGWQNIFSIMIQNIQQRGSTLNSRFLWLNIVTIDYEERIIVESNFYIPARHPLLKNILFTFRVSGNNLFGLFSFVLSKNSVGWFGQWQLYKN